jgi:5-methylcytosine-specific restriction endonuclease McrA
MATDYCSNKTCVVCGQVKPLSEYHATKSNKDGHVGVCKPCAIARARAWHAANKERHKANCKKNYEANKQAYIKRAAEWRRANPGENRKAQKKNKIKYAAEYRIKAAEYRKQNPEIFRERQRKRYWRDPEKSRIQVRIEQARRRAAGNVSRQDVERLFEKQKGRCACCSKRIVKSYHVDHVIPISAGGTSDRTNLQLLCPSCNASKSDRDPLEFMQSKGFLL